MALTNKHHGYYGEEVDPSLAAILGRSKKATGGTNNVSIASDETIDFTTTAMVILNTTINTCLNPPIVAAENV